MQLNLKAARINKSMTQQKAAKAIGVAPTTLCNWETGKTFPNAKMIARVAEVYGLSVESIKFF